MSAYQSSPTTPAVQSQRPARNGPYTPVPAGARRPRGFLIIDGQKIAVLELSTTSSTHFTADSFSATLSQRGQPQNFNALQWDKLAVGSTVQVCFGFLTPGQKANELPTAANSGVILTAIVDSIVINRVPEGTVTVTGRDLTSKLIDAKTANNYTNKTASDAVTLIAKQFGLTPNVTATKTPIGKYQNDQYSSLNSPVAYWDLIVDWANQENFDAYVSGTTLYFGPPEADSDPQPWVFYARDDGQGRYWANVKTMELTRNANLSKDITVTVLSHISKTGQTIKVTASRAGTRAPTSSRSGDANTVDNYLFRRPGMTQAQAQNWANAELAAITQYEREFTVSLEGSPDLHTRKKVIIQGTNTSFDDSYYVRTINRSWNRQDGFSMTVTGKNIPSPTGGDDP